MRRALIAVVALVLFAVPAVAIATFLSNGGWSQDSAPAWWWWVLAAVSAAFGIGRWSARRRARSQSGRDVPVASEVWATFHGAVLFLVWFGITLALLIAGDDLARIVGLVLLLCCLVVLGRVVRRRG